MINPDTATLDELRAWAHAMRWTLQQHLYCDSDPTDYPEADLRYLARDWFDEDGDNEE